MMFSTRRRREICLLLFVCLVVSECKGEGYPPAPECASFECPSYTVVHSQKEFEIRSYEAAQWISSPNVSSNSYTDGAYKGFLTLFLYIKGFNSENVEINTTAPGLVDVQNSIYTVYFYLPKKYQTTTTPPPQSSSNQIKPVKLPKHKYVAVRRFDGSITDKNIPEQLALLKKSLSGSPYQRAAAADLFTVVGYNSLFELPNPVNEIFLWFD